MDSPRKWADLPSDILSRILSCLNAQMYHYLLRAVCPAWRSSLPLSGDGCPHHHHLPLQALKFPLVIEPEKDWDINIPSQDSVAEKILFLVSPLEQATISSAAANNHQQLNWIIQVEETEPNKWSFSNPLTGMKVGKLPPGVHTGPANLLGYRFTELGRSFSLRWMDEFAKHAGFPLNGIRKLICSSGFYSMEESLAFMAFFDDEKLAFWKPGLEQWHSLDGFDKYMGIQDIISFQGRFYVVVEEGGLVMIDPSKWWEHVSVVSCHCICGTLNLIVSEGSLYLTVTDSAETKVYVLKNQRRTRAKRKRSGKKWRWFRVRNIGDQVFFVGQDAAFSLSSSVLGWNMKNCIYIDNGYWRSIEIHDLNEDHFVPFFKRWADHGLFWPPPISSWINPDTDLYSDSD